MVAVTDSEALRRSSLKYLWMHNRDWTQMAEDGEPRPLPATAREAGAAGVARPIDNGGGET